VRLLLIGAGTHISTRDVEDGYLAALRELGVDIKLYALEARMPVAQRWLDWVWKRRGANPEEEPGWADLLYQAGREALEMALRFEVDWVLVISAMFLHPDILELMRRAGLKTAVLFTESPYEDTRQLRVAQLVTWAWTMERTSRRALRAGYLAHAYDPARHQPADGDPEAPAHDVVFVGTGFEERCELLGMVDWRGIDLGLYGSWGLLGSRNRLRRKVRGGMLSNDLTVELYRRARIGLNLFRTSAAYGRGPWHYTLAESANPRTFELAACGVFQISQYRPEVAEIFGDSVPTFQDPHELQALVGRALNDADWRLDCANRARHLVAPHTFAARAAQLLADLEHIEAVPKGA
jgi:spore maturation protein CgeB